MKSYRRPGWSKSRVMACLVSLGIALFFAGTAQAGIQYEYRCEFCHTMPPLDSDSGRRLAPSGAVKGNHQSHAGSSAASCVKCHGSELTQTGHRDKLIQVTGVINGSPLGTYNSNRAFINQTTVPPNPLGTCSNVNCHFESASPAWGRKPDYSIPAGCNDCHLMNRDTGNHPAHAAYYGSETGACVKCHPDHGGELLPFRHATSATSRGIAVSFNSAPNSGGSYSGDGLNFLPSQNKTSFGGCSGVYCHSDGLGNAPLTPATWGAKLPAGCTGCHGGNALSGNIIASGAHGKHINNANFTSGTNLGSDYRCARCHNGTVNSSSDVAVVGKASHVDGFKDVSFSDGGSYSGGSCSATMCHSAGKAGLPPTAAVPWNGGALDCKGCHGAGSLYGEPNYGNAGAGAELANSHGPNHVTGSGSCVNCHASTTTDGATIVNGSSSHTDGSLTVSFPEKYDLGNARYDGAAGAKTCSNTYCHSDGNKGPALDPNTKWGGKTTCRSCHGGDTAGATVATKRHTAHLNNYSGLGRGNTLMCAECHAKTVGFGNNSTLTNRDNHVNGFKEYSGVRAGSYQDMVCSNVYCHSSGEAVPVFRNMTGSKAWDRSGKLGCNGCHGYDGLTVAGEPNYASRKNAENSHLKHVGGANMTDSRGCAVCHRTTVDRGVKNKLRDYSSAHLDGKRDVSFAVLANYSGKYFAGNKNCANTYCHGPGNSAAWGTPGPLPCTSCHGAGATLAGQHGTHWQGGTNATDYTAAPGNQSGTATSYNFECSSCHRGAHAQGPATPNNNAAEVFFGYTSGTLRGSYNYGASTAVDGTLQWSNGTCDNTYCHSKGDGSVGNVTGAAMNWGSPAKTLGCNGCHGGDFSKENPITSNLHRAHLDPNSNVSLGAGNGRKCGDCHALTVSFANNTTLADKRLHVNKFREYSGLLAGGRARYDRSAKSCNDIYCHSNGKRGEAYQFRPLAAWTSTGSLGCNGCHGNASVAEFGPDAMGTPNYVGGAEGSDNANSHKVHIDKMGISSSNQCYFCHARTVDKYADKKFRPYSTTHLSDGATHVSFGAISTVSFKLTNPAAARYTGKTCSTVACHSNGRGDYVDVKWGARSNCAMCHPLNRLSRGHIFHVYTSASNTPTAYDNYTANLSTGSRYNYGCANCHPLTNPNHTKGTVLIDLYPDNANANTVGTLRAKNGSAIKVGGVVAGTSYSGTTLRDNDLFCDNVYCHSNGYAGNLVYAQVPGWYNGVFTGDRCANCHGNTPNSNGSVGSASHYNNQWLGSDNTPGGHVIGIHTNNITNDVNFTGLLTPGTTDPSSHGATPSVTPTTIGCNTCHYSVITTSANSGSAQCISCHGSSAPTAFIANKGLHVNGSVSVEFRPTSLYSKAQLSDTTFAAISSVYMARVDVYKAPGGYDVSKITLDKGSYAGSGGNCTTVCHFNKPIRWDNIPAATCNSCHIGR
jgi:predicted CxxxxCH...CXXCH cytochrome family protein